MADADSEWVVRFADGTGETVQAAYLNHGSTQAAREVPDGAPVILRDSGHKVVFFAPLDAVLYVRRLDAP
jgi:hypothetical protein